MIHFAYFFIFYLIYYSCSLRWPSTQPWIIMLSSGALADVDKFVTVRKVLSWNHVKYVGSKAVHLGRADLVESKTQCTCRSSRKGKKNRRWKVEFTNIVRYIFNLSDNYNHCLDFFPVLMILNCTVNSAISRKSESWLGFLRMRETGFLIDGSFNVRQPNFQHDASCPALHNKNDLNNNLFLTKHQVQ